MNKIVEAKTILPLPTLMASFGLGELAKQSARCPFHDDRHSSFSVWQGGDGRWSFKCHAGCGAGDEINFLELHENLSRRDAVKRFLDVAGLNGATPPRFEAGRTLRESSARNRGENRMEMNPSPNSPALSVLLKAASRFRFTRTAESLRRTCARRTVHGDIRRKAQRRARLSSAN